MSGLKIATSGGFQQREVRDFQDFPQNVEQKLRITLHLAVTSLNGLGGEKKAGQLQYLCRNKVGIKHEIPAVNSNEAKHDSDVSVILWLESLKTVDIKLL